LATIEYFAWKVAAVKVRRTIRCDAIRYDTIRYIYVSTKLTLWPA